MTSWDDLNARARGLATHLLGRAALESLAQAEDLPTLAAELARRGYPIEEGAQRSGTGIELAARREGARRLATLRRWAGRREPSLAIVFEDEERRSISSLIRARRSTRRRRRAWGSAHTGIAGTGAGGARQPAPGAVASLLPAWRHPLANALLPRRRGLSSTCCGSTCRSTGAFAERAFKSARQRGTRGMLARHVQRLLDIENAFTTLVLSEEKDSRMAEYWVPGGRDLTEALAERAVASGSPLAAGRIVAAAFAGTPLASAFAEPGSHPEGIEGAVLGGVPNSGPRREPTRFRRPSCWATRSGSAPSCWTSAGRSGASRWAPRPPSGWAAW
jgi:hypothetical protein